jgi:hypothetical protein
MKTPTQISIRRCLSIQAAAGLVACLTAGLWLTIGTGLKADEKPAVKETKKEIKRDEKKQAKSGETVVITGSLIPQKVKPDRIPSTASPVIIIGQKEIERSGGSTVAEVLRKQGVFR